MLWLPPAARTKGASVERSTHDCEIVLREGVSVLRNLTERKRGEHTLKRSCALALYSGSTLSIKNRKCGSAEHGQQLILDLQHAVGSDQLQIAQQRLG